MTVLAWALVAVPLVVGATLAAAGRHADAAAPAVGVATAVATLALACASAALRPRADAPFLAGIRAGVAVDGLSAVMVVTVAAVTLAVLIFSAGDFTRDEARGRFFGLMLVFAGAMLVTVTATDLAVLLMGWEVMGATSWALIGFWWHQPSRVAAANTALLTTRAADVGLYLAAGAAVAGGAASLRLDALRGLASPWLAVAAAGVIVAAFGKSGQLPFSFWLSKAMEGPSPVSALLHSATMVAAGAYLLLRLHPLLAASGWAEPTVAWVGAATAVILGAVAVAQSDLKQLLAASTCAQLGFMFLAAGTGGVAAGAEQLVAHAATKSLLFLAAGAWLSALGTKQLAALRGAARRYRLVGLTFTVGALSLAGLAPLSLWVTKDAILASVYRYSPVLYAVGLLGAVLSAVYSIAAARIVWAPLPADAEERYDREGTGTRQVSRAMRPPLVVLAVGAATLGMLTVTPAIRHALGAAGEPAARPWQLALSTGLVFAAAGATWWWHGGGFRVPAPLAGWLRRWLDLEKVAHVVVVRPTLALAAALAAFDDGVVDDAVGKVAAGAVWVAAQAARTGEHAVEWAVGRVAAGVVGGGGVAGSAGEAGMDGLVAGIAGGARRLGRLARRPQTGMVHQYYAQAAVAFAVLVVVVVVAR